MYNIDLSFFNNNNDSVSVIEEKSNTTFQHMIIDAADSTLHLCEECETNRLNTPKDNRNIFLAKSKGVLSEHYCVIPSSFPGKVKVGDQIVFHFNDYHEISEVIEVGEIVPFIRSKSGLSGEILPVFARKLNEYDDEKINRNKKDEERAKPFFYKMVEKYSLTMKLVGVHFQFDRKKLYFFYTADGRVDFRQLAKSLASEFKTRIELRQIGVRDEAKIKGGLGTCGREYCCSSFMHSFKHISSQFASEQHLSTSLTKLSGPCGKLKCCLSFELNK